MENKLSFLSKLKISMFKIKQYPLFLKEGLNKAITYILILSIFIGMILGSLQFATLTVLEKSAKILLEQEEFKFEMSNGVLDFKSTPYKEEEGSDVVVIDSNITLDDSSSIRNITVHKDRSVAFLKDGMISRLNGTEYKFKYIDIPFLDKNINNEVLINVLQKAKPVKYLVFIFVILITYIVAMFNALLISLAGIISNKMNGSNLQYKDILKMSMYSLTLPMILKFIIPIGSLSILISAMYVTIAIGNISREEKNML